MPRELTDSDIRQLVLNDEHLYLRAREFGGGGDNEMYDHIYEFIDQNRAFLVNYIQGRLS